MQHSIQREFDWLIPFAVIAAAEVALAGPRLGEIVDYYIVLAFAALGLLAVAWLLRWLWRAWRSGVEHPIRPLLSDVRDAQWAFLAKGFGIVLAACTFAAFSTLKSNIPAIVPFWADPPLILIDRLIFGQDAWRSFSALFGFAILPISFIYNAFVLTQMVAFTAVVMAPASAAKTRLILTYLLMWTVLGLVVAYAFSSVGPIFYDQMSGHQLFAELPASLEGAWVNIDTASYVWGSYESGKLLPGSGLSAMPSLHVAGSLWIALLVKSYFPRFAWLGWSYAAVIYVGSVLLGWHYATDGIVGALGTILIWKALPALALRRREFARNGKATATLN